MVSTVGGANAGTKTKNVQASADYSYIEEIRNIVKTELPNFPFLFKAPDALYYLMATFGAESNWRLFHGRDPNRSSRHLTVVVPDGSSLISSYQNSNVIKNVWNSLTVTPQIKENVKDGWYAHGISAVMGTYMVKGCSNNLGEWRRHPEAVSRITSLNLEVDPGQSITGTIFAADTALARQQSVVGGMIIFNAKYRAGLKKNGNDTSAAMQYALGAYLGKQGAKDANGTSPDDRRRDIGSNMGRISILQSINVRRSGDTTVLASSLIDLNNKEAKDRGSNTVSNNPATAATTNSGSNGQSQNNTGCETA